MKKRLFLITGILIGFCTADIAAQSQPHVFQGAELITISGDVISNGVLVVQNGKITAIGAAGSVSVPRNSVVVDVSGKVIMPGLVDTHSHIGEGDGGDRSSSMHPDVRILDAIDPMSDTFKKALAGGVTTANVMPGSGLLISGQTVYLKTRPSGTIEEMIIVVDEETGIFGGLKMANGTNPLRAGGTPGTRAKSAALVRAHYLKAQDYKAKIDAADGDPDKMPARDLQMETLVEVLEGKRIVHNHTHRHDDILTAIRLAQEFGYRLVLQHVSEAWKVADEIAASGYPASIIGLDSPGGKMEAIDIRDRNGVALERAGADVAYHTDDGITDSRLFLRMAAFGVREGMSREKALESLTLAGARMMDLQHRVGSLEPGKDADFIILSGDPFSVYTQVLQTWIEGEKVWDRDNPDDRKYATGGYEIFRGNVHTHYGEDEQ
jgi:imidazolonepropionase-like amidohydrolase